VYEFKDDSEKSRLVVWEKFVSDARNSKKNKLEEDGVDFKLTVNIEK
jgi:hypothetical protein